jgi:multiple antibiotic resistance protein
METEAPGFMTLFVLFLVVLDPFGNLWVILALTRGMEPARRSRFLVQECLLAGVALVLYFLGGAAALRALGISQPALQAAGGLILFIVALNMLRPITSLAPLQRPQAVLPSDAFLVPVALPLLAGPVILAAVSVLRASVPELSGLIFCALGAAWLATSVILLAGQHLRRLLGERGLDALQSVTGLVLLALSVDMVLGGVMSYVRSYGGAAGP